jgi:carboxymethylenebutenolidase
MVLSEAFGLNDDIRRIADRFAAAGYVAAAPDLFEGGSPGCLMRAFRDLRRGGGPLVDRALAMIDALAATPDVAPDRIGVAGFCLGGGYAMLLGTTGKVRTVSAAYGRPLPAGLVGRLCPVVASFGGRDRMFGRQGPDLARRLSEAGIPHDVKTYPEAGHSFMNRPEGHRMSALASRPLLAVGYDEDAAGDAWRRILEFFARHL